MTTYRPLIHTQADLQAFWSHICRPLGFRGRSLWLLLIGRDDRPTPILTEVADLPDLPDGAAAGFADLLARLQVDEPGSRWAVLLCRPGTHGADAADLAWASALRDAMRNRDVPHDTLHLATDVHIAPLPLDDLPGYRRAS